MTTKSYFKIVMFNGLDRIRVNVSLVMETHIKDFHHENTDYLTTMVISLQTVLLLGLIHKQTPAFPISITSMIILSILGVSKTRTYNFLMTFIAIIIKKSLKCSEQYAMFSPNIFQHFLVFT